MRIAVIVQLALLSSL